MASLFDTLGTPASVQPLAAPQDTSAQIQKIQDVGATGKQAIAPQTKRSSLGEASELDSIKAGLKQLDQAQTETLKTQQLQAHDLDVEGMIQNKMMDQAVLDMRTKSVQQSNQLLGDLERGKKELNSEQAQLQLEQLGFNLRLANDRYVFNLQSEGIKNRLTNKYAFDEALQAAVFGNDYVVAKQAADDAIELGADKQKRLRAIAKIDLESAIALAGMQAAAYRTAAIAGGVSSVISAGAQYAASQKPTGSTPATPPAASEPDTAPNFLNLPGNTASATY